MKKTSRGKILLIRTLVFFIGLSKLLKLPKSQNGQNRQNPQSAQKSVVFFSEFKTLTLEYQTYRWQENHKQSCIDFRNRTYNDALTPHIVL